MSKFELKEGQTYICTKSEMSCWWTEEKEYHVVLNTDNEPVILDDQEDEWYTTDFTATYSHFKLKEKTFDLNTLTTAQLKEYVELVENKENAESLLNDFIERMSEY